ncbi:hypothetical protein Ngar_c30120 [Candidatus Nitrososphaera gargensis Ga9.2]|uniref:Uncharacterized protein n=1 Tax=Nitrososphaera gargensis (strain Ga9.2) TaxID=1237085 RepID=K0IIX4_NITGG|nr:hypothetical protein Ngar_c30120 [Candidatus Nitrososphaera gargensis Ga9.2]
MKSISKCHFDNGMGIVKCVDSGQVCSGCGTGLLADEICRFCRMNVSLMYEGRGRMEGSVHGHEGQRGECA